MATQTLRFYESPFEGSFAEWVWDDVLNVVTSVHVVNPLSAHSALVLVMGGVLLPQSQFPPGTDTTFPTPVQAAITFNPGFTVAGLSAISAGHVTPTVQPVNVGTA